MKKLNWLACLGIVVMLISAGFDQRIQAQYLISTKAGFVNRVDGKVDIQRRDSEDGDRSRASLSTQMKDGDMLITGADGRAEILLNPGSYLRLDKETEIRAINTSLTEACFEVTKGSVIVEIGTLEKKTAIQLLTPQGPVAIGKAGLHRIDVKDGVTTIAARQGELHLGTREQFFAKNTIKVSKGKMVRLDDAIGTSLATKPEIAKLNKDQIDSFDVWSFNRAQALTAANYSTLRRSSHAGSLSFGWYYNPFYNFYTYIPGSNSYWSPYGFPFFHRYDDYYYYYPYGYPYYYPGGSRGSSGGKATVSPRIVSGADRVPIQRDMEDRRLSIGSDSGFGADIGPRRIPSSSSSSSSMGVATPNAPISISGGAQRPRSSGSTPSRPSRP